MFLFNVKCDSCDKNNVIVIILALEMAAYVINRQGVEKEH